MRPGFHWLRRQPQHTHFCTNYLLGARGHTGLGTHPQPLAPGKCFLLSEPWFLPWQGNNNKSYIIIIIAAIAAPPHNGTCLRAVMGVMSWGDIKCLGRPGAHQLDSVPFLRPCCQPHHPALSPYSPTLLSLACSSSSSSSLCGQVLPWEAFPEPGTGEGSLLVSPQPSVHPASLRWPCCVADICLCVCPCIRPWASGGQGPCLTWAWPWAEERTVRC